MRVNEHKVLHLVSSSGLYGAERVILNLSRQLNGSRFTPIVGAFTKRGAPEPEIARAALDLGIQTRLIWLDSKCDPLGPVKLQRVLLESGTSIIHSHGYKPTLFAFLPSRRLGIPLMVTCHLWFNQGSLKLRLNHKAEALVMRFLPIVVGVSEEICKQLKRKGCGPIG